MSRSKKDNFNKLVIAHQREVYYFIRKMVLNHDDANDVTQNTFIKAWKGMDSFRREAKFTTWLLRIAYNESINFINKRKRITGISLDNIQHQLPATLSQDKYYSGDDILKILQAAIASLPEKQKAVFILKYYENKKYDEISTITGTSVGGLKASYHHAKNKIELFVKNNTSH